MGVHWDGEWSRMESVFSRNSALQPLLTLILKAWYEAQDLRKQDQIPEESECFLMISKLKKKKKKKKTLIAQNWLNAKY